MLEIQVTGVTGTPPYDVYVCDYTLAYCTLAGSGVNIPPTFTYTLVYPLDSVSSAIIKLIDSNGCEYIQLYTCPSPTPTPTLTPTPTPTNISCNCIQFENTSLSSHNFTYIQCDGTIFYGTIAGLTTLYVCGKSPTVSDPSVLYSIGIPCVLGACLPIPPPISPTPTPSSP